MRTVLPVLLVVLVGPPARPAPKVKPKDPHALVGRWAAVKLIGYGRDETEADKDFSDTFPADGSWLIRDGKGGRGRCAVKGTAVELTTDTGRVLPGIYERAGDTLTLCLADAGGGRPTESEPGPKRTYFVLNLVRPDRLRCPIPQRHPR